MVAITLVFLKLLRVFSVVSGSHENPAIIIAFASVRDLRMPDLAKKYANPD